MTDNHRASVLVVDDTEINIEFLAEFLGEEYDFAAARSGREALEHVAAATPDLVLLDIVMPGMDGFEV